MAKLVPGAKGATLFTLIGCLISCLTCILLLSSSPKVWPPTKFDENNSSKSNSNKSEQHLERQLRQQRDPDTPTSSGWLLFDTEAEDRGRVKVKGTIVAGSILSERRHGNSSNVDAKYQQSEPFGEEWIDVESFRENSSDVKATSRSLLESGFSRSSREKRTATTRWGRMKEERGEETVKAEEVKRKKRRKRSLSGAEQTELVGRKKRRLESKYRYI